MFLSPPPNACIHTHTHAQAHAHTHMHTHTHKHTHTHWYMKTCQMHRSHPLKAIIKHPFAMKNKMNSHVSKWKIIYKAFHLNPKLKDGLWNYNLVSLQVLSGRMTLTGLFWGRTNTYTHTHTQPHTNTKPSTTAVGLWSVTPEWHSVNPALGLESATPEREIHRGKRAFRGA